MSVLSLQQLFQCKCVLDNIDIRLCCRIESGVKQLLALVTNCGDIVLHYTYGELPAVVRRLPWFTENSKTAQAVCFDPTATWLLVVSIDGSLYIIPALSLVDKRQRIDCKWSVNDLTHFPKHLQTPYSKPLSVVWWQTLDSNQNALVGYEDGAIGLISLTDGRCLATCNVGDSISRLYLCQDNSLDCVSLLVSPFDLSPSSLISFRINGESGQQWRLILEQHSTGYIWPPEANAGSGDGSAASRLQSLKQMGVDKLVSLKQRFTEARGSRRDSQTSDTASESSHSDSSHSGPELLPHLCDTFFAPQYARNRYLFSAFYKPTSLLTIHAVDIESAPLYVHKLNTKTNYLLLTNRLIYTINDDLDVLSVVSTQLSECRLDGDTEFNFESLLAQFKFAKDKEKILNVYKLSDITSFNESKSKETVRKDRHKITVLPSCIEQLKLRKPKVDTCVVVTNSAVYKVILSCSPLKRFITLVTEESNVEKAERLAIIFGLNLQELLESCGDLLISEGSYHQGLILYKQAKVHLLKRVLKLAVSGDSRALLKFVHLCLSASKVDMSTATKIHMGNLAVMAYTELILRHGGHARVNTTRDFMNFLRFEEFYDQILAVNVACQSGHWSIVTLLAKSRGLQPEIVAALSQMLQTGCAPGASNYDFLVTLSEPTLTQSLLIYPSFCQKILLYIRTNIDSFPVDILQRFAQQLDPSQPSALPVITKLYQRRRISTSLDSTIDLSDTESLDQIAINARDFIETFIWVLIELAAKTTDMYNADLLYNTEPPERSIQYPLLKKFPDLHPLSCGYEHAAVIRNGAVYTMGMANSGCLGFGPVLTQSSPPKLVHTLSELRLRVLSVSCGRKHTLALTDFGVYAWGSNSYGQLGVGPSTQESPYPQMVGALCDVQVVDVATGQYHSMALTASGSVYTWGWGIHGQLGHGNSNGEYFPRLLEFQQTIVQIAAGHAHSLILTNNGRLYGFGSNAFGQLESNNMDTNKTTTPIWISVLPDIYTPIKKIATAYFHNIAVRVDEEVYTWGASPQEVRLSQSKYGQKLNGFGIKGHEPWKSGIHVFTGCEKEPVDQIAVGFRHSALLHCGKLLLCRNMNDEMSPPKLNDQDNLGILSQRFLYVSCGPDFTIAMDHSGKLLAWGNATMAQTLLGKPQDDDPKQMDGKVVVFKNTRRFIKIPHNIQSSSEASPIEIPGLPTMAITFSPPDHQCLLTKTHIPHAVLSIENKLPRYNRKLHLKNHSAVDQVRDSTTYTFGHKTLHYALETYSGYYDTESVLCKLEAQKMRQAASKIAVLNGHFSDGLGFQIKALETHLRSCRLDFGVLGTKSPVNGTEGTIVDSNKCDELFENGSELKHSSSGDKIRSPAYLLSGSSSLDSIQQWSDDLEDQGGRESPCNISEMGDVRQSMSQYVQSIKTNGSPTISSVSRLISESPYNSRNLKNKVPDDATDLIGGIKDGGTREVVQLASRLIEFYIKRTYSSENHILMQNILLKCIEFWLENKLPVPILESILLKNMDKYFYPLSILLFCKNFNNNLGEEISRLDDQKPSGFLKQFSTKFCLQLCSMVLENVNKA